MGRAAEIAARDIHQRYAYLKGLKNQFLSELPNYLDEVIINTHPVHSLPHLVSASVRYIEGESVMLMLDDEAIGVSTARPALPGRCAPPTCCCPSG